MGSAEIEQDFSLSLIWPSCYPLKVVCSFLHCNEAINLFFKGFLFLSPPLPPPPLFASTTDTGKMQLSGMDLLIPSFFGESIITSALSNCLQPTLPCSLVLSLPPESDTESPSFLPVFPHSFFFPSFPYS